MPGRQLINQHIFRKEMETTKHTPTALPEGIKALLHRGVVIPAHPLVLQPGICRNYGPGSVSRSRTALYMIV